MLSYQDCVDMVNLRREDLRDMQAGTALPDMLAIQECYRRLRTAQDKDADGAALPRDKRRETQPAAKHKP